MENNEEKLDVIVVGGGPAGMIAAGRAAESGARVLLLEKNDKLGRKLLLTGNGRCNITQAELNKAKLVEKYGKNGKFLFSGLSRFGVVETINFFESRGVKTKIEEDGRIFPQSDRGMDVLQCLIRYMQDGNVSIEFDSAVADFEVIDGSIKRVALENGKKFEAKKFIIATGGKSFPQTGSSGDGYAWAEKMGHKIIPPRPSLVQLVAKEVWLREAEGASLKDILLTIISDEKKVFSRSGDCVFTRNGLSGPLAFNVSKSVGELLSRGEVKANIDLMPNVDLAGLDKALQKVFFERQNKLVQNSLGGIVVPKLVQIIMELAGMSLDKIVRDVTRKEREQLVNAINKMSVTIERIGGLEKAMVTSGGVSLKEIDGKTMQSRIIPNLFFAGEILDVDGPTGGYNLQAAWTSGYVAGECAAQD